jgi:hypothetical protein
MPDEIAVSPRSLQFMCDRVRHLGPKTSPPIPQYLCVLCYLLFKFSLFFSVRVIFAAFRRIGEKADEAVI